MTNETEEEKEHKRRKWTFLLASFAVLMIGAIDQISSTELWTANSTSVWLNDTELMNRTNATGQRVDLISGHTLYIEQQTETDLPLMIKSNSSNATQDLTQWRDWMNNKKSYVDYLGNLYDSTGRVCTQANGECAGTSNSSDGVWYDDSGVITTLPKYNQSIINIPHDTNFVQKDDGAGGLSDTTLTNFGYFIQYMDVYFGSYDGSQRVMDFNNYYSGRTTDSNVLRFSYNQYSGFPKPGNHLEWYDLYAGSNGLMIDDLDGTNALTITTNEVFIPSSLGVYDNDSGVYIDTEGLYVDNIYSNYGSDLTITQEHVYINTTDEVCTAENGLCDVGEVSGSGTTGYIPQWQDENTLNNSIIYQNESNIGIGTTTPTQQLHIEGNANITGTLYASNVSSNSPLQLQTNGTTRVFINDTTGYVGIGTITPHSLFEVKDYIKFNTYGGTYIGYNAGNSSTSANFNTAIGAGALYKVTTGSINTAIGSDALGNLINGIGNIAIGSDAGKYYENSSPINENTKSQDNIFIGVETHPFANNTKEEIVIGNYATGNGNNTITIGHTTNIATYLRGMVFATGEIYSNGNQVCTAENGLCDVGEVSGSGTTGYIPQWQDENTLNNSIIYQNESKLSIAGDISVTGNIRLGECAGSYVEGDLCYNNTDHKAYIYNSTDLVALW